MTKQLLFATMWGILDLAGGQYSLSKLPSVCTINHLLMYFFSKKKNTLLQHVILFIILLIFYRF